MKFNKIIAATAIIVTTGLVSINETKTYNENLTFAHKSNAYSGDLAQEITRLQAESTEITGGSYYSSVGTNLTKTNLLKALNKVCANHTNVGYDGLYSTYAHSDVRPDGTIWDFYGDFSFAKGQKAGSYKKEGDCYNREHIVAQSWFGSGTAKSDAFHVVPTDGYINNRRGNYPFGEVKTASYTYEVKHSATTGITGFNKLGSCSYPGYSGTVFEPMDCYKGDFARSLMYFAVVYKSQGASGSGAIMFSDSESDCYLTSYAKNLLLDWHHKDPVSLKEKIRNDEIYKDQKNRNPFIDNPSYADAIWGNGSIITSQKTLQNLTFSGNFEKNTYKIGDSFNPKGITIIAHFIDSKNNTSTQDVTSLGSWNIKTITSSTTSVTFTYKYGSISKSLTFDLNVISLDHLEIEGELIKEKYAINDKFDPAGVKIKAFYSDNSFEEVTNKVSWNPSTISRGTNYVTCSYTEGGITKTLSLPIELLTVTDIQMIGEPTKTIYNVGEKFDPSGLDFIASYNDGSNSSVKSQITWSPSTISSNTTFVKGLFDNGEFEKEFIINDIKIDHIINIEIKGEPAKKHYTEGETFDPTGIVVTAIYMGGSKSDVSSFVTYEPETLSPETESITGYYLDFSFTIEGIEVDSLFFNTYEYADVDDTFVKTHYFEGEIFNPKGVRVIATMTDKSKIDITALCKWSQKPLEAGDDEVSGYYIYTDQDENEYRLEFNVHVEVSKNEQEPSEQDENGEEKEPKKDEVNVPLIAGIAGGSVALIAVIVLLIIFLI